jgi:3-isopropylmalate dehydrogenase
VTRKKRYTVACLTGDGIGPELMAEASRALARVGRMHGFGLDEVHVPFGGDAVRRSGHPLPAATRDACRRADAVLVMSTKEPALEGVKAELDLTWRITRVRLADGRLNVVSPLADDARALAAERAVALACSRRARLTSVGSPAWHAVVEEAAERCPGLAVERRAFEEVVGDVLREPARFDVLASEEAFAEALSGTAAYAQGSTRMVASGRLSAGGPGIFGPTHGSAPDIAGQGVANPAGALLAAALMLGEGLGERSAARTLEEAVAATLGTGVRTPDLVPSGRGATTGEFMDALLAGLPSARLDTEFAGVAA